VGSVPKNALRPMDVPAGLSTSTRSHFARSIPSQSPTPLASQEFSLVTVHSVIGTGKYQLHFSCSAHELTYFSFPCSDVPDIGECGIPATNIDPNDICGQFEIDVDMAQSLSILTLSEVNSAPVRDLGYCAVQCLGDSACDSFGFLQDTSCFLFSQSWSQSDFAGQSPDGPNGGEVDVYNLECFVPNDGGLNSAGLANQYCAGQQKL
jgi:hypothetical protein